MAGMLFVFFFQKIHAIHHANDLLSGQIYGIQKIIQPAIGSAAAEDKNIAVFDRNDILRRRAIGMGIHSRGNEQSQLRILPAKLTGKIIGRKNAGHNRQLPLPQSICGGSGASG